MNAAKYYTKDEEIALLQAQLVQCTTAMRQVATDLRQCGVVSYAETLEIARSSAVLPQTTPPARAETHDAFDAYQRETERTAAKNGEEGYNTSIAVLALGLCGEAGEVSELIKKYLGHGITFEISKLKKELGDVLWYLTRLGAEHGIDLRDIAAANMEKLRARYPEGFVEGGGIR